MFREGLASVLASHEGMEVIAEVPNDSAAIEIAQEQHPDVVIMQIQLPIGEAKDALRRVRQVSPSVKVVICTMFENPRYIRELMEVGATAYVVKTADAQELIGVIRASIYDPNGRAVVVGLPEELVERAEGGSEGLLSDREMEILVLAARGLNNQKIASQLHLSESTVKRHMANIFPKMEVHSRSEAVRKALEEEWITIQEITE